MTTVKPFKRISSHVVLDRRIFTLREDVVENPRTGKSFPITVLDGPDWCNIIPVTSDGQVVFIRQWRHGSREITLEIPGGMVDPGEDPMAAAARELVEETGYRATSVIRTGSVAPNPAIQSNTTHLFLATGVAPADDVKLDDGEDIEVVLHPLKHVPRLLSDGHITHSLVVAAFLHLALLAGGRVGELPPRA